MGPLGPHGLVRGDCPESWKWQNFNFWVLGFKILVSGERWWALLLRYLNNKVLGTGLMGSHMDSDTPLAKSSPNFGSLSARNNTRILLHPRNRQSSKVSELFLQNLVSEPRSRALLDVWRTNSARRVHWNPFWIFFTSFFAKNGSRDFGILAYMQTPDQPP